MAVTRTLNLMFLSRCWCVHYVFKTVDAGFFFSYVVFLPHTDHSFFPPPDVYKNMIQFHCHRGFLQEGFPRDCSYTLENTTMFKCRTFSYHAGFIFTHCQSFCLPESMTVWRIVCVSVWFPHLCSPQAHRSAHNKPLCSAHSALPPRWLYSDTGQRSDQLERLSCRRISLHSGSPGGRSYRLSEHRERIINSIECGFLHLDLHLLTQSRSGNTSHTETHALSSSASIISPALLDMAQERYLEFLCRKLNHISRGTWASDCLILGNASNFIRQLRHD